MQDCHEESARREAKRDREKDVAKFACHGTLEG